MDFWYIFTNHFNEIIQSNEYYSKIFNFLTTYEHNVLLYGSHGFPTDLFIDEVMKKKFHCHTLYKTDHIWNKDIVYKHNQNFIEINLAHPAMPRDLTAVSKFIINIIKNKKGDDSESPLLICYHH